MLIKKMSFHVFADLLKAHANLVTGLGFTKSGKVNVLLDHVNYSWRVARGTSGLVMVWYAPIGETEWMKLGELCMGDFDEITIC